MAMNQLYPVQQAEIRHLLAMYQQLSISQLLRFFPDLSERRLLSLIRRQAKRDQLLYDAETAVVQYSRDISPPSGMQQAVWVLLDFLPTVTYHTVSSYPFLLTFYTFAEAYDVLYIPPGQEMLLNHILANPQPEAPRRLAIITDLEQISLLTIPNLSAYCQVHPDGTVNYYRLENEGENANGKTEDF